MEIGYIASHLKSIDLAPQLATVLQALQLHQPEKSNTADNPPFSVPSQTTTVAKNTGEPTPREPGKDDLALTRIQMSLAQGFPKPVETEDSKLIFDKPAASEGTPDGFNPADAPVQETDVGGSRKQPILQRNAATDTLSIGNFTTLTMSGSQHSCGEFTAEMLKDVGASPDKMVAEMNNVQISIYKICATNGSVVVTCRSGKIVVSPRQPRPDNGCEKSK